MSGQYLIGELKDKMHPRNPYLTVDIIIRVGDEVILIARKNPPLGWALPGGFVDYGESLESAAIREAKEETGLDVYSLQQFRAYSDPNRDPRQHNISMVFTAYADGKPVAGDDAGKVMLVHYNYIPELVFDHNKIMRDYLNTLTTSVRKDPLDRINWA